MKFGSPELRLTALVGSIQFLSSLVFSIVTALAPMFTRDLGIASEQVGTIAGSYMVASAVSGFLGTLYLDRFDRRPALAVAMAGIVFGVTMSALSGSMNTLVASRILTGIFSGPSGALSIAIIIDNVPVERRGRALGTAAAFGAVAQVVGIPLGLVLATTFDSWRAPFAAIAVAGAAILALVFTNLSAQRAHLESATTGFSIPARLKMMGGLLKRGDCHVAYGMQLTGVVPLVAITTMMPVFLVKNLAYPNGDLPWLYIVGGAANTVMARYMGRAVDTAGPVPVAVISSILLGAAIAMGYMGLNPGLPLLVIFPIFFVTSALRLVVTQTVTMRIPRPEERAGFQALSNSIQSAAMGGSALAIPLLLGSTPDGRLTGVERFSIGVIVVTFVFPLLVHRLERLLRRSAQAPAAA